jgi:protein-disulfide isomerase
VSKQGRDNNRAKRIVEQQKAAERRRRITIWTTVAVVVVLVVAGGIGFVVAHNQQQKTDAGALTTPSVAVDNGSGFAVGSGPVVVDMWEDFMCPICNEFEQQSGTTIKQLAQENRITARYHPVAILNRSSEGTNYSTRAAGAAAAAAEQGKFIEYHDVLYQNQPQENTPGLTDAKLISLGQSVGLTGAAFTDAVNDKKYDAWADKNTDTFSAKGFTGTPTILVAGKQVTAANGGVPGTTDITTAINKAASNG